MSPNAKLHSVCSPDRPCITVCYMRLLICNTLAGTLLIAPITCCVDMLDGLQVIHLKLQQCNFLIPVCQIRLQLPNSGCSM